MSRLSARLLGIALGLFLTSPQLLPAADLTAQEKAFVDQHLSQVVQIRTTRLDDASLVKVFAAPFYRLSIVMQKSEGEETVDLIVARSGDALISIDRPSSDADLPKLPALFHPQFRLKTPEDGAALQGAFDLLYPIIMDQDRKAAKVRHIGTRWMFARGTFFEDEMGFLLETDAAGVVQSAKFLLRLPRQ